MIRARNIRHGRYIGFLVVLFVSMLILALSISYDLSLALSFDLAALLFLLSSGRHWLEGAPETMRDLAARNSGGRLVLLGITLAIVAAVLAAIGGLVARRGQLSPTEIALVVFTLVLAWTFANVVMAYHYAHHFYDSDGQHGDHGGLTFPSGDQPCFADFVNFAFVIGMTCQTADIAVTKATFRRVSTLHGVVAFFFNLGILALVVNLVASSL